jgi:hypothetical protein
VVQVVRLEHEAQVVHVVRLEHEARVEHKVRVALVEAVEAVDQ